MNFFRVWASALVLIGLSVGAARVSALDAQRPLRHSRTTEPHLTEPHRTVGHHAGSAHHGASHAAAGAAHAG
ncbi:MAG TPA: hypothetical protein VMQ76_08855, partial [Terracidiphilus sp.]|nr:hypothetical protein [Terracidiphilus sp.]